MGLLGWECVACGATYKNKKSYYEESSKCPEKCNVCKETLFKRIEDPVSYDGLYENKPDPEDGSFDQISSLSEGFIGLGDGQ